MRDTMIELKLQEQEEIARQTAEFLANGGKITQVPSGESSWVHRPYTIHVGKNAKGDKE